MKACMGAMAATALVLMGCLGPRTDGPLQPTAAITVGLPLQNIAVTWGMPLGGAASPYELRRVELLEASGFDVIAVKACEGSPWDGESYLNCAPTGGPWPPAGVQLRDVDGTTIGVEPEEAGGILIGVKLANGASSGRIGSLRIVYTYAGTDYVVEQPWALEMPAS